MVVRYRACFLEGEKVLGDFPGLCKILHETTLVGFRSCIPVFSPRFVGSGLSWLYFGWKLLVDDGIWLGLFVILSMLVCRYQLLRPKVQAVGYCDRKRVRFAVKVSGLSPQALRWTISIPYHQQHVFWLGVHGPVGVHGQVGVHG